MFIKIAICDDDSIFIGELEKQISTLLQQEGMSFNIETYHDGSEILGEFEDKIYDIVFLDIDMPKVTGIEVANQIRMKNPYVIILFITNRDDLVFHSIQYSPFRFIRKNFIKEELPEAIHALVRKLHKENKYLTISFNGKETSIRITDIYYLESCKHDIYIYTHHGTYRIRGNLSKMEKQLAPYGFIRTHSGYVVNSRHIFSIEKTQVVLRNGNDIPLSRYRIENVKQKLQLYGRGVDV